MGIEKSYYQTKLEEFLASDAVVRGTITEGGGGLVTTGIRRATGITLTEEGLLQSFVRFLEGQNTGASK